MAQVLYGDYETYKEDLRPTYYCYNCGLEMLHISEHIVKCIICGLKYDSRREVSVQ